ncbi:MAG: hypothetical protein V3W44_10185 [Dehalococcoidales bacterium]
MMAGITIPNNSSVIVERSVEGNVVNVHLLPLHQMHFIDGPRCWCGPKVNETMDAEVRHIKGAHVWQHYPYQPKWDTPHGFR